MADRADTVAGRGPRARYAAVHFGKSLLWAGEDALALYIMVQLLALPPTHAGALFLASAVWNAICDGMFGLALQRWPALLAQLPLVAAIGLLLCGLGFAALPLLPPGAAGAAAALLVLFRTGFSLLDLPHNMLTRRLAAITGDLGIARVRSIGAGSAALLVGVAAVPLVWGGLHAGPSPWPWIAGIGALAMLCMAPLPGLLRAMPAPLADLPSPQHASPSAELAAFCLAVAIGIGAIAGAAKSMLHIDFAAPDLSAIVVLLLTAARLGGVLVWAPLARKWGVRPMLATALAGAGASVPLIACSGGLGTGWTLAGLLLFGTLAGGVALLCWARLSEILRATGLHGNDARYAAGFAACTMAMKLGLGVSAMLAGLWLSSAGAATGIAPDRMLLPGLMAAAGCAVAAAIILSKNPLALLAARASA
jgi:GPH family glycoside/pentoside/hexuronide:cation symporter